MALSDPILRRKRMSAVGGTATARVSMCGAAASCSIALNVCQILEIDLEKLLRAETAFWVADALYEQHTRRALGN